MEQKDYRLSSMPSAMCHVEIKRYGEHCEEQSIEVNLWSYYTHVLTINYFADSQRLELSATGTYSVTTARHINRFTAEFLGRNYYHEVKRACDYVTRYNYAEPFDLVTVAEFENSEYELDCFFKALDYYAKDGKRFYNYTKLETERFNAHRWGW